VFDFAGFHQAVVMGWSWVLDSCLENAMPGFRKRDNSQGLLLRDFQGAISDQDWRASARMSLSIRARFPS